MAGGFSPLRVGGVRVLAGGGGGGVIFSMWGGELFPSLPGK